MSIYVPKFKVEAEIKSGFNAKYVQRLYPKGVSASAFKRSWDEGFTGKGIVVAVIDTGIDSNHPDLKNKVIKKILINREPITESHGTHVAGTIAANGWIVGGAPDASLMDVKVLGKNGGSIRDLVNGISSAVRNGANIINMSLGSSSLSANDIRTLKNAIDQAWIKGVVCIAAAGNDGTSICTPDRYSYPASVQRAESIAACEVGENLDTISLAYFSNENNMVDLTACGQNVVSTVIGGRYGIYSGTSMATPHVSAMAANLAQYLKISYPKMKGESFSTALVSLLHINVLKIESCGIKSQIKFGDKILVQHSVSDACVNSSIIEGSNINALAAGNISFGLGFLRYKADKGPEIPSDNKYYYNGIFLGHQVNM